MIREFKGVWIKKDMWLNDELSIMEKVFMVEIDSLNSKEKGCYASNSYFSDFFGISKGRCSQIIKSLEKKGFLTIKLIREKKVIIERQLRVVNKLNTLVRKLNKGIKKTKQGYLENAQVSNTVINNTLFNNTIKEGKPSSAKKPAVFNRFKFLKTYFLEKYNMYPENLEQAIRDHMKVRDSKRGGKDQNSMQMYINELEKLTGGQIIEMVDIIKNCTFRGWVGIFPLKQDFKSKPQGRQINECTYDSSIEKDF